MVTQVQIAKRLGIDVSSVNKILNRMPGPVFRKETIQLVFKTAAKMGYRFREDTKPLLKRRVEALEAALREIVPSVLSVDEIATRCGVQPARAAEIKELAYGKQSA